MKRFYEYEKTLSPEKKRNLGIVYTPEDVVSYINRGVLERWSSSEPPKVLDPCCGTGVFLYDMAKQIAKRWHLDVEEVYEKYITGYDLDAEAVTQCRGFLPRADIKSLDSLDADFSGFDVIVTNPPYVRIQNLGEELRNRIQSRFSLAQGDTDIYIAFLEKLYRSKKLVGLICPNSWIRNKSSNPLRREFFENKALDEVVDFGDFMVFDKVQTYTSIIFMNHGAAALLHKRDTKEEGREVAYNSSDRNNIFLGMESDEERDGEKRLFDVCDFKIGIATLSDGIYYGKIIEDYEHGIVLFKNKHGEHEIERGILRPCIKASKVSKIEKDTHIIYPYIKNKLMNEDCFRSKYPMAYKMLSGFRVQLLQRDRGKIKKEQWYGYGRTQGLSNCGEKLLLPPFQKDRLVTHRSKEGELYISGYGIFPKNGYSIEDIESLLSDSRCFDKISPFAKSMSKGWIGVSKNIFQEYKFVETKLAQTAETG